MNKNIINFLYGIEVEKNIKLKGNYKENIRLKEYYMIKRVVKSLMYRENNLRPMTDYTIPLLISYTDDINKYKIEKELFNDYYGVSIKSLNTNDIYIIIFDIIEWIHNKRAFYALINEIMYI